jgi:hypothetical protein
MSGTITDTMDIITTGRKGKYFNTLEKVSHLQNQQGKSTHE